MGILGHLHYQLPFLALAMLVLWPMSYLNILIASIQLHYAVTYSVYEQKCMIEVQDWIKNWKTEIISDME
jgi:hypothetical protein